MRKALSIALMLVVALAVPALAKPTDQTGSLQKFLFEDVTPNTNASGTGVFGVAALPSTTFFGGTVWAADSARWEAIEDGVWTFDSGVGSHFDFNAPYVNPYKYGANGEPNPLHAYMEGWIGIDNTYSELTYFRRITLADTTQGAYGVINGSASMWAGVFQSESEALCYANGVGYGNSWFICIGHAPFSYDGVGGVKLDFTYNVDSEPGYDYLYVYADTTGNDDDVEVAAYTGFAQNVAQSFTLNNGVKMRSDAGNFRIKFCAVADGGYSDEDGLYDSVYGLASVDDIVITDLGSPSVVLETATFESGDDGWSVLPAIAGLGGEWSNIVSVQDLPSTLTPCPCQFGLPGADSVMVFEDLTVGGHGLYQDNIAMSPWIDLLASSSVGAPVKFISFDGYFELPLNNYIFVQTVAQWYPAVCPQTGKVFTSFITSDGFVRYFGGVPTCRKAEYGSVVNINFSSVIAINAEQVRIGVGALSYCRFYGNCTGVSNSTPWFDNVKLGIAGTPGAPSLTVRTIDEPADAFPESGNLRIDAPGRVSCNNIKGFAVPEPNSSMGDTLTVGGGTGGAEVYVQFAVAPGPGCGAAVNSWLSTQAGLGNLVFQETKEGLNWYAARMDTARQGTGGVTAGRYMTAYHDAVTNRPGTEFQTDPNDLDPQGQATRLLNDIFPDNLFTPGTRLNMFFKTKFVAGSSWFYVPDTAGVAAYNGNVIKYFEMEVMPSSMAADSTFNCVLFVDHASDRGWTPYFRAALDQVMTGTGNNYEGTPYDVFHVEAPSSQQGSFGRPLNTEYNATIVQALGYKAILWDASSLGSFDLVKEDADVLIPWLTLTEPGLGFNNLYLSGEIAQSITNEAASEPSALRLLNEFVGAKLSCATYRDPSCGVGAIQDTTGCVDLNVLGGADVAGSLPGGRTVDHVAQGNGCPQLRSFDVLDVFVGGLGAPKGEESYSTAVKGPINYASVTNDVSGGPDYRTVIDGVSAVFRRDTTEPCAAGDPTPAHAAIVERLEEVLTWFGYAGATTLCEDPTAGTSIPVDPRQPAFKTALANFAPNPLLNGAKGSIQFTMARDGKAAVEIFDVNGRLVRTVFDGLAKEGLNVVSWDGMDETLRPVSSGVYFYRLKADDQELAKKLVVVRNGN